MQQTTEEYMQRLKQELELKWETEHQKSESSEEPEEEKQIVKAYKRPKLPHERTEEEKEIIRQTRRRQKER